MTLTDQPQDRSIRGNIEMAKLQRNFHDDMNNECHAAGAKAEAAPAGTPFEIPDYSEKLGEK
ncbi:hypothetical protein RP20_CCG002192 [Aedes albopictus]|nr:hypothetical protein RP20_CCG011725 [Aedes albopictus]KXJ79145.1 hypothetical protein RP20_CCG002192 [Aedes albopictus]